MNKMTSRNEIGGVKLRIRAADTDLEIGRLTNIEEPIIALNGLSSVKFDLTPIAASLIIGKYYKIQLAYIDKMDSNNIGYYSTVSIIKCTAYPTVGISNLSTMTINPDYGSYVGEYSNLNDPSEKCYTYKWTLYDFNDNVLLTTDWLLHNANNDESTYSSIDKYDISYAFEPNLKYKIQYSVTTNNGLVVNGPKYLILGETNLTPELKADLAAELNYDEGLVSLSLVAWPLRRSEKLTTKYTGSFIISRASSIDNFTFWTKLTTFTLTGTLPTGAIFRDFTVEHGKTYRYALQQFNTHGIYSQKVCAPDIKVVFEDMFLYDGDRQLKVRFNPKVSSFKTVLQDTKKNTLGSQFPFFFRNGNVAYKEFPISGLISYLADDNEQFMTRTDDLQMPIDWENTTDILDDNLLYERTFKLKVLDWLNDGNIKLFRSPGEGNYLVRLMNSSLTPNDSLSRMIHTFTCTADEIAECTTANLVRYGFLNTESEIPSELLTYTIVFDEVIESILSQMLNTTDATRLAAATQEEVNAALAEFRTTDLLNGDGGLSLIFENCDTQNNKKPWFVFDSTRYFINNGKYALEVDEPGYGFYITNPTRHMNGQVTCTVLTMPNTSFDTIAKLETATKVDTPNYNFSNYLDKFDNQKYQLNHLDKIIITLNDHYTVLSNLAQPETSLKYYLINGNDYSYEILSEFTANDKEDMIRDILATNMYSDSVKEILSDEIELAYTTIGTWTAGTNVGRTFNISTEARRIINNRKIKNSAWKDQFYFEDRSTGTIYSLNVESWRLISVYNLPPITISVQDKRTHKTTTEEVTLAPNQICVNNTIYTITSENSPLMLTESDIDTVTKLQQIYWGPHVSVTFVYSMVVVTYEVELNDTDLITKWNQYNNVLMRQTADRLQYRTITNNSDNEFYNHTLNKKLNAATVVNNIPNAEYDETSYFVWNTTTLQFDRLSRSDRAAFTGDLVWTPLVKDEYSNWDSYGNMYADAQMYANNFYEALAAALE